MASMTAQATAQAHWSREYRKRRKAGIRVYEIELPEIEVTEGLRRAGLLAADAESHEEIRDALKFLLRRFGLKAVKIGEVRN